MPAWTASPFKDLVLCGAMLAAMVTAVLYSRFDGAVATVWVANAILMAVLANKRPRLWPRPLLAATVACVLLAVMLGISAQKCATLILMVCGEAMLAAALIRRWVGSLRLDSPRAVLVLVASAGVVAPAVTAPFAAAWLLSGAFWHDALIWYASHAAGTIAFSPLLMLSMSRSRGDRVRPGWRRRGEALLCSIMMIGVSVVVFSQHRLPLTFLPILPLALCTLRFGRLGAASGIAVLATIGGILTANHLGPIAHIGESAAFRALYLQAYLAAAALIVLPVAAVLRQRGDLYLRLQGSEARFRLLADHVGDAILLIEPDGRVSYASPAIAALGGYDPAAMVGRRVHEMVHPDDIGAVVAAHLAALREPGEVRSVEYRAPTVDGRERWFETRTRGFTDDAGRVMGVVSGIRDISHRKALEQELAHAARSDALTGLPNRRSFDDELKSRCGRPRAGDHSGCVAILDIDHFKAVNDRYGHDAGDAVLVAIGRVARETLRGQDLFARLGGEEFGILLDTDPVHALAACNRLLLALSAGPVDTPSGPVLVTASIGVASITPGCDPADILRIADRALYRAKGGGRNRVDASWAAGLTASAA